MLGMAREVADCGGPTQWWRSLADRRAARRRAVASADGAIRRLTRQLAEMQALAAALDEPGVRERLAAAAPALADLCGGRPVTPAARLRRNVAMHAAAMPNANAPLAAWRRAQHGQRLGPAWGCGQQALRGATASTEVRVARDGVAYSRLQFVYFYGLAWEDRWGEAACDAAVAPRVRGGSQRGVDGTHLAVTATAPVCGSVVVGVEELDFAVVPSPVAAAVPAAASAPSAAVPSPAAGAAPAAAGTQRSCQSTWCHRCRRARRGRTGPQS